MSLSRSETPCLSQVLGTQQHLRTAFWVKQEIVESGHASMKRWVSLSTPLLSPFPRVAFAGWGLLNSVSRIPAVNGESQSRQELIWHFTYSPTHSLRDKAAYSNLTKGLLHTALFAQILCILLPTPLDGPQEITAASRACKMNPLGLQPFPTIEQTASRNAHTFCIKHRASS